MPNTTTNTSNRAYPLPTAGNDLAYDVAKIITALTAIDADIATAFAQIAAKAGLSSPNFTGTPTAPTASPGNDTSQIATTAFVVAAVNALVNSSPGVLDTLNELAAALGNDPNFATTITTSLSTKLSKTGPGVITGGASATAEDVFTLKPSDYAVGKSGLAFSKAGVNAWQISASDSSSASGSINVAAASFTFGGSTVITAANIGAYAPTPDLSPYMPKAGGTFTGAVVLQDMAPILYFRENDQTLPAGRRRLVLDDNVFTLRRNTAAAGDYSTEAYDLTVSATGDLTALGNVTAYSDERLKENIRSIEAPLAMINRLYGARFNWNEKAKALGKSDAPDLGVIAQNVAGVVPEAVHADAHGNLTVAYDKLIPVLIEAVKELSARVKELEGK